MIRLSKIWSTSFRIELRNFNVNKTVNILQRHFNLTLHIVTFPISLFTSDFNSTDDGINSKKLLLIILYNLFYSTKNLMANLSVRNNVNVSFNKYLDTINTLVKKYTPIKKYYLRNRKFFHKPWLIRSIQNSVQKENKLFKKFLRCKTPNTKTQHHNRYKQYRNIESGYQAL